MKKSESIKGIAKALALFHIKMGKVGKDSLNPFHKSKYASLPNILEAIQIPLEESGLVYSQLADGENALTTILIHVESGEYFEATSNMHLAKSDPQALGSAITYSRRYALGAILGLIIDDDDDGNAATPTQSTKAGTQSQQTKNDDNKPWLTEKDFKLAVGRIAAGEQDIIKKLADHFKINKDYRAKLDEAQKQIK